MDNPPPIDLNTATREELTRLPGIGRVLAARIEEARPFATREDLLKVDGIKHDFLDQIAHLISPLPTGNQDEQGPAETEEPAPIDASQESKTSLRDIIPQTGAQITSADEEKDQPGETADENIIPEAALEDLEPLLETQQIEAASSPISGSDQEAVEDMPPPAVKSALPAQPAAPARPAKTISPGGAFWMAAGSGLIVLLLSILFSLGALALLNGGLHYATPQQLNSLARQVNQLETQSQSAQQSLDELRIRLNNLEGLSGRMTANEKQTQELGKELDAARVLIESISGQTQQMAESVESIKTDVDSLQTRTEKFQNFLQGLRDLLEQTQAP